MMKTKKKSPVGRYKRELSMACLRSAITNGSDLLAGDVDHRSAWVRRLRDLILAHTSDLGGSDNISAAGSGSGARAPIWLWLREALRSPVAAGLLLSALTPVQFRGRRGRPPSNLNRVELSPADQSGLKPSWVHLAWGVIVIRNECYVAPVWLSLFREFEAWWE